MDVLVVGGGPAGIGAALGAVRKGAKTLLVENHSFFGGVASWCLGMPINQVRPAGKPRSAVHELLIEKLLALGDQAARIGQHELFCNVDYLKVAAMDALEAVGCRYLVCLRAVDAMVEGNRLTGVIVATKNGLAAIRSRVVVDCTGDADVAFHLYDRESGPETEVRQQLARTVNLRPGCQAVVTSKRSLENYLHPEAICETCGVELRFGDDDHPVSAAKCGGAGTGT